MTSTVNEKETRRGEHRCVQFEKKPGDRLSTSNDYRTTTSLAHYKYITPN